jgi:hypothetical protein
MKDEDENKPYSKTKIIMAVIFCVIFLALFIVFLLIPAEVLIPILFVGFCVANGLKLLR